jgi:phenylacetate-CoA ligase
MLTPVPLPSVHGDRPPLALGTWRALRQLERLADAPWETVAQLQLDRLRDLVDHAQRSVAMYAERYPEDAARRLRRLDDLASLPTMDRSDAVTVPAEARRAAGAAAAPVTHTSSGSSGHLVTTEVTRWGSWWRGLLWLRRRRSQGLQPWSRQVTLRSVAEGDDRLSPLWRLTGQRVSVLDPNRPLEELADALVRRRPRVLVGSPHAVAEVGRSVGGRLPLRGVVTGGMVLTPEDRATIAAQYGRQPYDVYGMIEVGPIAGQCRAADLYHVDHESVIVEVVDEEGTPLPVGSTGDLVVTCLWNEHMPFLRYRTGDRVTLAERPCRCGHRLPSIGSVDGRAADWFWDGRRGRVAPQRLFISAHVGDDYDPFVDRYRVVQSADGDVSIEILPKAPVPDDFLRRVERSYAELFHPAIRVTAATVAELRADASGKFRQFSSASTRAAAATETDR